MGCSRAEAGLERSGQGAPVEMLPYEDQRVDPGLRAPFAVELRVEEHVDSLEHEPLRRALDAEDPLHAVDVVSLGPQEPAYPFVEAPSVQVALLLDSDRRDGLAVLVRRVVIRLPGRPDALAAD